MQKEVLKEPTYVEELLALFRSNLGKEELLEKISDYHESDIADAMEQMTPEERKKLYPLLGEEYIAEILSYTEDAAEYLQEINLENAARVISEMDSDDAVVCHHEQAQAATVQVLFQPFRHVQVEMVSRLVQNQQIRSDGQKSHIRLAAKITLTFCIIICIP